MHVAVRQSDRMVVVVKWPFNATCLAGDFLQREFDMLKQIQHPYIVQALELSVDGPGPALATEYVPGCSLNPFMMISSEYGLQASFARPLANNLFKETNTCIQTTYATKLLAQQMLGSLMTIAASSSLTSATLVGLMHRSPRALQTTFRLQLTARWSSWLKLSMCGEAEFACTSCSLGMYQRLATKVPHLQRQVYASS